MTLLLRQKPPEPPLAEGSQQQPLPLDEDRDSGPTENGSVSVTGPLGGEGEFNQGAQLVDDENPSVNLHEFLVNQLQEPKSVLPISCACKHSVQGVC